MCGRRGRKDGKTVIAGIIPLTEKQIMVKLTYTASKDGGDDSDEEVTEMLMFRLGKI